MTDFEKFPSISNFHSVNRVVGKFWNMERRPTIRYRPKIKVHGTNAGVRVEPDGKVIAQKRTSDLGQESDNAGFRVWVESQEEYWASLAGSEDRIVVYGEWAGPGVQKGVAVSQIDKKRFFVFALLFNETTMLVDPVLIEKKLGDKRPEDVHILPWAGDEIEIDFMLISDMEKKVAKINEHVLKVEQVDPYFNTNFDVQGVGEGLVYVPVNVYDEPGVHFKTTFSETASYTTIERESYSEFTFKAKGEKHQVNKSTGGKSIKVTPEVAADVQEFVEQFATLNRFKQGLEEACNGEANLRYMGDFLKWFGGDVKKESAAELEVSDLEWRQVAKAVNAAARDWMLLESKKLV